MHTICSSDAREPYPPDACWKRLSSVRVLVALGIFVFDKTPAGANTSPALLYTPIPLLIWAALRFGLGGISASMLIITFQAIWGTMHGHGPFLAQTPAENATALQLFLLVTATPLMLLAVVIEAERRTEHALRQSYEQNQDLGGRLINAQEDERARIARDLHDDLSQQLAGVAIIVSGLKRKVGKPGVESEVEQTFATLQERTAAAATAVRNLSHELHPGVLKHAGLTATLRGHCADIERHHQVTVTFNPGDGLDSLDSDVALCLFRVVQEALTNVLRHARARTICVSLMTTAESVELNVVDDGVGFVASERTRSGLGLRSIHERVRFMQGHVSVDSRPGEGTKVLVRIPIGVSRKADRGRETDLLCDDGCDVGEDTGAPVSPDYGPHGTHFNDTVNGVQLAIAEAAEDTDHTVDPETATVSRRRVSSRVDEVARIKICLTAPGSNGSGSTRRS